MNESIAKIHAIIVDRWCGYVLCRAEQMAERKRKNESDTASKLERTNGKILRNSERDKVMERIAMKV